MGYIPYGQFVPTFWRLCIVRLGNNSKNINISAAQMYSVCHSKSNVSNQNACDFMIIIGANFFIIKSEVQTFIGLIGCSIFFF